MITCIKDNVFPEHAPAILSYRTIQNARLGYDRALNRGIHISINTLLVCASYILLGLHAFLCFITILFTYVIRRETISEKLIQKHMSYQP